MQNTVTVTMTIMTFATGLIGGASGRPFLSAPQSMFLGSTELASPANFDLAFSLNESNLSDKLADDGRLGADVAFVEGAGEASAFDIYTHKRMDK